MRIESAREYKLIALSLIFALGACGMDGAEGEDAMGGLDDDSIGQMEAELTSVSLGNPGFESEWSGWTRSGSTGLSGVTHAGSNAAKVSASTG